MFLLLPVIMTHPDDVIICAHCGTELKWGTMLVYTFVYFTQLLPSGGAFLAEMAGQQIGLNGRETKLA